MVKSGLAKIIYNHEVCVFATLKKQKPGFQGQIPNDLSVELCPSWVFKKIFTIVRSN